MPVMANVATHEDVAADAVLAYLFVDANGDGMLDEGETVVSDGAFTLTDSEGETISSATKKDGGVLFSGLAAGAYSVTVTDAEGAELALDSEVIVTVDAEAEAGQVVYFALPAGE